MIKFWGLLKVFNNVLKNLFDNIIMKLLSKSKPLNYKI